MAILPLCAACLAGQTPSFSTDVRVVSLLATVRDKSTGAIVQNLSKDDFRLEEDGRPQTIRYFSQESDLPLALALLVDTSQSMRALFAAEHSASNRFLERVLRPDRDLASVVHFDVRVGILQGFTSSREKLDSALEQLRIPPRLLVGTKLYPAIVYASEDLMRAMSGRKAFILLSDGMDVQRPYARDRATIVQAIEYGRHVDLFDPV